MQLVVECTHCRQKYRVANSALGKQAKCAKCGREFALSAKEPGANTTGSGDATPIAGGAASNVNVARSKGSPPQTPGPATSSRKAGDSTGITASSARNETCAKPLGRLTIAELSSAFRQPFPRRRPNIAYRVGIVLISFATILLPLIYLAFIALIGFGVYFHAQHDTSLLQMGTGKARIFAILVYAGPLIAGPIAIFFMFKPLLARPISHERYRSLTRQSESLLFSFTDRICDEVGAPRPKRIDVDCQINAAAGFRRGLLSMFGNDLVLTIGLPLVAGLNLQEFGGVLAHEFGHFSQGMGMRLSYLVRSIMGWFARVVYQRDQWDEWLEQTTQELDFRIGWIFIVAQLFVLVGRGLLWVLLHIGLAITGIMLRQMEFDADRYEALLVGSAGFGNTVRKLHLLNFASVLAQSQLSSSLEARKLVDDYPGLVIYHAQEISREGLPRIERVINESRTAWFDSHPCDKDRIAAADKLGSPGIFSSTRPAADLFSNFSLQAAATTWDWYLGIFGPKVPRAALQSLPEFVLEHKRKQEC